MKDLYIIVHADRDTTMKQNPKVAREIRKIRKHELSIEVKGNPTVVEYDVPLHDRLYVCGFYHGRQEWDHRCVDEQIKALRREGYSPELYAKATVFLDP